MDTLGLKKEEKESETPTHIYMATPNGVEAYSLLTSEVYLVTTQEAHGIAYDPNGRKIYTSHIDTIFRANVDGSDFETVFSSREFGYLQGLSIEPSTGCLYALTNHGRVIKFNTTAPPPLTGVEILSIADGSSWGAVAFDVDRRFSWDCPDSNQCSWVGRMYSTNLYPGFIWRMDGMMLAADGSNVSVICGETRSPCSLTVDTENSMLYWTDDIEKTIRCSNLEGQNARVLVQLPSNSKPWGLVYHHGRIYWGNQLPSCNLESCNIYGEDVQHHFRGSASLLHLALVPAEGLGRNVRLNPRIK